MTAVYATQTCVVQLTTGGSHLLIEGALRDSLLSQAAVDHPTLFTASPPVAGQGHVSGRLAQYLATYPGGP